jgi:hypothetical protein
MANVSMYKLQGHDQIIIRIKGGPKKYQIKNKPQFAKTRLNNTEWRTCTIMGSMIRMACSMMKAVEDYPVSGALNALCKHIQKLDTENEHGERVVYLSKHKECLQGFTFSRKQVLESVLRVPLSYTLDRTTGIANIQIPALNTNMQLYNFRNLPYYRIIAQVSNACDLFVDKEYETRNDRNFMYCDRVNGMYTGEWLTTTGTKPALNISLEYPINEEQVLDENGVLRSKLSLILSMGIEFGKLGYGNEIEPVKYAGTGKILMVV